VNTLLLVLVLALVGGLLWAAGVPRPRPAARGEGINPPTRWREDDAGSLVVATYNIHGGKGLDGKRDVGRSAQIIAGADVAALQEVRTANCFGARCQAAVIARANNKGWLFAPTQTRWFRDFRGNALITAFPVKEWHREPLVNVAGHRYRNLTTARLQIGRRDLWVLFTHLHTRTGRDMQLRAVLERFAQYETAILLGDLNTTRADPQLVAVLQHGAVDAVREVMGDHDRNDRVDWIITKGMAIDTGGMHDVGVSDHPYFWAAVHFEHEP
jgi:endonuclease/exonuclease/phosphatase family metal-dependent hydrolase